MTVNEVERLNYHLIVPTKFPPFLIGLNRSRDVIASSRGESISANCARPRKYPDGLNSSVKMFQ